MVYLMTSSSKEKGREGVEGWWSELLYRDFFENFSIIFRKSVLKWFVVLSFVLFFPLFMVLFFSASCCVFLLIIFHKDSPSLYCVYVEK